MAKVKQKQVAMEKREEALVARSGTEMVELALRQQLQAETLTRKEVTILVDVLGIEDRNAKSHAERVDAGKVVLKEYGKLNEMHELFGDESVAKIGDKTVYDLTASKVIKLLEKEGKLNLLDTVLSVSIGEFRKYLGSDLLESKSGKTVVPYASVSLKKRKDKEKEQEER